MIFVGAGEAAVARDARTGACAIVYETPSGEFAVSTVQKGGDLNVRRLELRTRGTLQETVTAEDLKTTYAARCR